MAFWVLWKEPWFKRNIPDMRVIFDEYLYQEWYNSLSDEDREYLNKVKARKEKEREDHVKAFLGLGYYLGEATGNKYLQNSASDLANILFDK